MTQTVTFRPTTPLLHQALSFEKEMSVFCFTAEECRCAYFKSRLCMCFFNCVCCILCTSIPLALMGFGVWHVILGTRSPEALNHPLTIIGGSMIAIVAVIGLVWLGVCFARIWTRQNSESTLN